MKPGKAAKLTVKPWGDVRPEPIAIGLHVASNGVDCYRQKTRKEVLIDRLATVRKGGLAKLDFIEELIESLDGLEPIA